MLSAGDHVRNLLGRYCERIDAGDFDGVGALFAGGVLADEHGTVLAAGDEAVAAFYASMTKRHDDGTPRTKHLVVDTVLEPDGDAAVVARSSYLVLQALDGLPLQPIIAGRYVDRFELGAGGWAFAERRFVVDLTGDLSHHLGFSR
ncbi:MAG: nuclear transport factor 2 family protein [Actinomycetota bacterium]|nr:nuclear transport factor 2 family protein [Actinomycetota bacterium]